MERDFIGYGRTPPQVSWPGAAKIAISVVINYEEGSEYSLLDGSPHHETNNEVLRAGGGGIRTRRFIRPQGVRVWDNLKNARRSPSISLRTSPQPAARK